MTLLAGDVRYARPSWFEQALAAEAETSFVDVNGVAIEMLTWGRRGAPGLLLVPGHGANAHWWAFIAPFFAEQFRVASLSLSGMGRSGWRTHYTATGYVEEVVAVADAAGLQLSGTPPVLVGHSYGGAVAVTTMATTRSQFSSAVIVDSGLLSLKRRVSEMTAQKARAHRIYPDLDTALRRFRFLPEQPTDNLFIADYIARQSLKQVEHGWTWRFDPFLSANRSMGDVGALLETVTTPLVLSVAHGQRWFPRTSLPRFSKRNHPRGPAKSLMPDIMSWSTSPCASSRPSKPRFRPEPWNCAGALASATGRGLARLRRILGMCGAHGCVTCQAVDRMRLPFSTCRLPWQSVPGQA
ncbi:alpha/beta fold hydrolase [Devosia ginsengisoli]|uniref:Alpha/beta hydrolase n=1 Tax=Devosia ginsengisoli TaxID=400770 RepID=A0A5B8LWU2_9HYPH|nr:alpha/beta hydrolase [Devosia ginsengisoli]QDZ11962.1 alpha/beta hydrolase [Devosia ginsengisoli]